MSELELECPSCNEHLAIDAAFAGSVCRCSRCGALLRVPGAATTSANSETAAPAAAPVDAEAPADPLAALAAGGAEGDEEASASATPAAPRPAAAPAARSSKGSKGKGVAVAVLIAAALAGGGVCWLAYRMLMASGSGVREAQTITRDVLGGYDPNVNPFLAGKLNFLGVPVVGRTVLLVDASMDSQRWLKLAREAVASCVRQAQGQEVQVLFWSEEGGTPFPDPALRALTAEDQQKLASHLDEVYAVGRADLAAGLTQALKSQPGAVVLVTSQAPGSERASALQQAISAAAETKLFVVLIDRDAPVLNTLAQEHGGLCVTLPLQRLVDWYQDAKTTEASMP